MFVVNSYGSRESSLAVNSRLLVRQKINTACKAVAAAKTWSWHWQLTTPGRWYRVDRWRPGTSYTGKQQSARYLTAQTVSYRSISWMHLIVRWKFQNLTSLNLKMEFSNAEEGKGALVRNITYRTLCDTCKYFRKLKTDLFHAQSARVEILYTFSVPRVRHPAFGTRLFLSPDQQCGTHCLTVIYVNRLLTPWEF